MPGDNTLNTKQEFGSEGLKFLAPREIALIDDLLDSVGEFGEVRLTVRNGKLRFAERLESIDALKYEGSEQLTADS